MKKLIALFIPAVFVLSSCLKEKTVPVEPDTSGCWERSYTYNIRPIINKACKTNEGPGTGCHDAWIDDFSQIQGLIENGKWQNRVLVDQDMPVMPNIWGIDSLTQDELTTMQCWIDQGYPEN